MTDGSAKAGAAHVLSGVSRDQCGIVHHLGVDDQRITNPGLLPAAVSPRCVAARIHATLITLTQFLVLLVGDLPECDEISQSVVEFLN